MEVSLPLTRAMLEYSGASSSSRGSEWMEDTVDRSSMRPSPRKLTPNLTRKTHKKSRAGCYKCKIRKIKCDERKPSCENCLQKSVQCVYPLMDSTKDNVYHKSSTSIPPSMSGVSDKFSLQDMQFFHHFLTIAYPHLPLGNDKVWLKDIPQFAQEHSYLMHAMLALGASHLGRIKPNAQCDSVALMHRGHAITGFNRALAKNNHAYGEADAMIATCYALTFQSSYMPDGMADFLTFVRGCSLAIGKIRDERAETALDLRPNRHFQVVMPQLQKMPQVSPLLILEGLDALDGIRQQVSNVVELGFQATLRDVLTALQMDAPTGYLKFVRVYTVWCELGHEEFTLFLNPHNITSQILLAHFIGLLLMMVPLTSYEWPTRAGRVPDRLLTGHFGWFREIEKRVPGDFQYYLKWPRTIVEICLAEISGSPFRGPSVLMMDMKHGMMEEFS